MGAVERITGHSEEDIKSLGCWRTLVIDEDRTIFDNKVIGITPGSSGSCELRLRHKSGRIVWVASSAECVLASGTPDSLRLYGGLVDITECKIDEEALRQSEDKFSKAFHMNPDAILITRLVDGMIVMVNEGFKEIFGSTEEEVIGKTALELNIWVNPEDRNRVIEGVKADGKVNNFEFGFRNKAGDVRSGLMSASIITLDGVGHVLSITRDITERRLAQEQLFQAQKMEAVGTLAGGFAHDFNNKLQVIAGYVELILFNKDLPETLISELDQINQTVVSCTELIKGMMVFSRKTPVGLQPIAINKIVEQTRSMLTLSIPKMIEIEISLADDLWVINAVSNQIDQILTNLAINASDAMPDGGKITIKTKNIVLDEEFCRRNPKTKPGKYALITVSDTGTGMNQDTASHIFEPFFTTKEAGKGTGLGLAVVYGIVEQHGGRIICDSEPSVGTTFSIYLPAIEELPQEQCSEKKEPPRGRGETILLVDDEPDITKLVSLWLTKANYNVITASNGEEALELYEKHREGIKLVILDIVMPKMDGSVCLRTLLTMEPKIKVLVASGVLNEGMAKDSKEAGAKGFIRKPFDMPELLTTIRDVQDKD
jgi:PAS domain S-box-containing protein